ncbi:TPA: hypothetical protein MFH09_004835 [Klebsiella pneumoniae]|nr:hypothetical protein [Klebsiella pneumoniae]
MPDKESIQRELALLLATLALTGEQRDFVESMYQDNTSSRGMVMTNKQLRIRYGLRGKHKEKVIEWDGCDQINKVLSVLVEDLNLPTIPQTVNLLEHGIDDVFYFDEVSKKWEEIPTKWLARA